MFVASGTSLHALQALLDAANKRVEILNIGLPGVPTKSVVAAFLIEGTNRGGDITRVANEIDELYIDTSFREQLERVSPVFSA